MKIEKRKEKKKLKKKKFEKCIHSSIDALKGQGKVVAHERWSLREGQL